MGSDGNPDERDRAAYLYLVSLQSPGVPMTTMADAALGTQC